REERDPTHRAALFARILLVEIEPVDVPAEPPLQIRDVRPLRHEAHAGAVRAQRSDELVRIAADRRGNTHSGHHDALAHALPRRDIPSGSPAITLIEPSAIFEPRRYSAHSICAAMSIVHASSQWISSSSPSASASVWSETERLPRRAPVV